MGPPLDVLDGDAPAAVGTRRAGWVVGLVALALVVAAGLSLRPDGRPSEDLRLLGHTGHALQGQSSVRLYFLVRAGDEDVAVDDVEVVLGDDRQRGSAGSVDTRGRRALLVDLVPDCRTAVRDLPLGTLRVAYTAGGEPAVEEFALPVEGSLPRLLERRCRD
ncbi:MAG TPA: hypothetical protein VNU66_01005 [Mycobacteriales bacterium]|nr:hypothetical protein [Mycobacteriales bacterium]